jgi:hypothetical protein
LEAKKTKQKREEQNPHTPSSILAMV